MSDNLPPCPQCHSPYTYADGELFICPECGHEWSASDMLDETPSIKDANGNPLQEGDKVTLIKDLKVKGSSMVLKVGTKAQIKRFAEGDHDIDCKVEGAGDMMLKSKFVKRAN